ncbi:MAG TPA: hypothetical protein VGZ71_03305 [Puia sp.]|jgi:hypothetical protein|nr:hypothetical protein [Puia sp.]
MTNEIIALIANLALALSFIVGLVFGIVQVRLAARDRRERLTLETLREFQTREFVELMLFISSHDLPSNRAEFLALPSNEQVMILQFSQEMESLGILVAERLINIDLVDKTLGSFVTTAWQKYKIMFMETRGTLQDPFLGEYFQWLAERIDERMGKNPRKPFFESPASTRLKR